MKDQSGTTDSKKQKAKLSFYWRSVISNNFSKLLKLNVPIILSIFQYLLSIYILTFAINLLENHSYQSTN